MKRGHVLMLPVADERGASTRYRVLAHRPALHAAGFTTEVRVPLDVDHRGPGRWIRRALDMARDVYGSSGEDLVLIHRKTYPPVVARRLRRRRAPIVFDMDDAIDLPPPRRRAAGNPYRRNFVATVEACDLVLCGNRYLASRLPHARFEILPTAVDTGRFRPGAVARGSGRALGWVGYSDNLPYLEALEEPLRELARRHPDLRLVVVADRAPRIAGVPVEFRRWRLRDELSCFAGIDVGLMPLDDTPWTRGKCAFKAIQYMALGIPAVASPVGMTPEVIRDGDNGFLPAGPASWVEVLDALLSRPDLAATVGDAGRRTIEADYSLEVVSKRLLAILDRRLPPR